MKIASNGGGGLLAKVLQVLGIALVLGAASGITACNTVEGAGEDVEEVGEGIQGAAEGARDGG